MSFLSRLFRRGQIITQAQALACIANRPMMMHDGALDSMLAAAQAMPERGAYLDDGDAPQGSKPEYLISINNGIGTLSISGPLFAHYGIEAWWYGGSAYDVIGAAFDQLMASPDVSQIVMMIDSPGGTVTGCFELSDKIYAARGTKPIVAITDDCAFSAAYCIASAADRIEIPRSGGLGSIGVRSQHVEMSKRLDMLGYVVTTFVSGAKKADFDSSSPLSDSARTDMQAEVDRLADIFIGTVARNRGIDADAVRALQAGCLFGPSAIAAGLGDSIGPMQVSNDKDEGEEMQADLALTNALDKVDASATDAIASLESDKALMVDVAMDYQQSAIVTRAILTANLRPDLAVALMKPSAGVTAADVDARIAHASAIANICFAAGLPDVAADYVTANTPIDTARTQLIDLKATSKHELDTNHPPASKPAVSRLDVAGIYERRNQRHTP